MDPIVDTLLELYRSVHGDLRNELNRIDEGALHWTPGQDTNSVAVLVVHLLGSEAEVLGIVHGEESKRIRDDEFVRRRLGLRDLLARLDEADALLEEKAPAITLDDLRSMRLRPNRQPQTGLRWLLQNYGHAREHLAHIQLTRQLYAGYAQKSARPETATVDTVVRALEELFRLYRSDGRAEELDRLQQHLFTIGAEIGEALDALDLERLRTPMEGDADDVPT